MSMQQDESKSAEVSGKRLQKKVSSASNAVETNSEMEKRADEALVATIQGLDLFIAHATSAELGNMVRILRNAKEEIVYWAVQQGMHETAEEKFINRILHGSALFAAADLVARLSVADNAQHALQALMNAKEDFPAYSLVHPLRESI
jgi:hypothetical protein